MFTDLIQKIADHPRYGPAVQGAVEQGLPLALNCHSHGPESDDCVSICTIVEPVIELIGETQLEELAHIGASAGPRKTVCR